MILKMRFHKVQPEKISAKAIWCFANVWPRMSKNRESPLKPRNYCVFEKISPRIWIVQCKRRIRFDVSDFHAKISFQMLSRTFIICIKNRLIIIAQKSLGCHFVILLKLSLLWSMIPVMLFLNAP